jgi:DegV family protein with EDD domain
MCVKEKENTMTYKIIADSSADIAEEKLEETNTVLIPFFMNVDGVEYKDNQNLDLNTYMKKMNESGEVPQTACPSPNMYLEAMKKEKGDLYIVTISSKLSGSYNAAMLAKRFLLAEEENRNIHVFDSKSASAGEHAVILKINELLSSGLNFEEVIKETEAYISKMQTLFVLENVNNLHKAGRLSLVKKVVVEMLNIKLLLGSNKEGEIALHQSVRGMKKALRKMIEDVGKYHESNLKKRIVISHCDAEERAKEIKKRIEELYDFDEIKIIPTRGLSSNYANLGGIVLGF